MEKKLTDLEIQALFDSDIDRLLKIVKERNSAEENRVQTFIARQEERLPALAEFNLETSSLGKGLRHCIDGISASQIFRSFSSPLYIKGELIQLLEYKNRIRYTQWVLKKDFHRGAPDDENIDVKKSVRYISYDDDIDRAIQLLNDLLWMLGKIARKIQSTALTEAIECIIRCERLGFSDCQYDHDQAVRLVDDIIHCWNVIKTELNLMDEEEKCDVYPQPPVHDDSDEDDDFDEDQFSGDDDPDFATSEAREHAYRKYAKEMNDIMPKKGDDGKPGPHPMEYLARTVKSLADEMEKETPSIDTFWNNLDYDLLGKVLGKHISLSYENYERVDESDDENYCVKLVHDTCWEETPEETFKKQIVADLERLITAAATLSKKINSESYAGWTRALVLLKTHAGDFYNYGFFWSRGSKTPKKDLKEFISLLKIGRQKLWSDKSLYNPASSKLTVSLDDDSIQKNAAAIDEKLLPLKNDVHEQALATRPPEQDRANIITLVRDIRVAKIKGITSYPKATEYVRRIADPSDEKFYERCAWARAYAKSHAKKSKAGQDKFWASIAQDAKPSAARQRAKAKSNGMPGITPTLHN